MRMKNFFLSLIFCFVGITLSWAQKKLMVEGAGSNQLYLNHQVAPKEGLFSIGRMYHINPKDLAAFNQIPADKGLTVGQIIRIPLNEQNFSQAPNANAQKTAVPVFYAVREKEGMYRVSVNNNKVPAELIRSWNSLPGDQLQVGQQLVIGYLVGGQANAIAQSNPVNTNPVNTNPVNNNPVNTNSGNTNSSNTNTVGTNPVGSNPPVNNTAKNNPVVQTQKPPVVNSTTQNKPDDQKSPVYLPKGSSFFQRAFEEELKSGRTVQAKSISGATFKSTSGWQDGKFYVLINQIQPGTIVKMTNSATGKTIFAKVLGEVPDVKQNAGLQFRLSNAGASELGVADENKFTVDMQF